MKNLEKIGMKDALENINKSRYDLINSKNNHQNTIQNLHSDQRQLNRIISFLAGEHTEDAMKEALTLCQELIKTNSGVITDIRKSLESVEEAMKLTEKSSSLMRAIIEDNA